MTPDPEQHDMLQNPEDFSAVREFFTSEPERRKESTVKTVGELAREAGGEWNEPGCQWEFGAKEILRFAALVRAQALSEAYDAVLMLDKGDKPTRFDCCTAIRNLGAAQEVKPTAPASSSAG